MSREACRVIITQEPSGLVNVSAPMKYKELCYNILDDAQIVLSRTAEHCFSLPSYQPLQTMSITMNMSGLVDIQAPLPPKERCEMFLKTARKIIEQFDAPEQKVRPAGFADCLPNPK